MTYETENDAEAAERAAFVKTVFEGLDDPGDDNASRVKAGAEVFSKADASAETSKHIITELLGNASENALIAANLNPPDGSPDMRPVADALNIAAASGAAITLITSDDKTLSKRITLGDYGRLIKDSSASILRSGHARLVNVPTATALAEVLDNCEQNQALLYGRFVDPNTQEIEIGTKGRVEVGQIPRTKAHFTFAPGPGWCLVDVDGFPGDPVAALTDAVPELAASAYVVRRSTSFGVKNTRTADTLPGGGWHISILLARQSDVERFLEALHKRLWLKGYGWIKPSAAGTMLERSPVDLAMRNQVQPVFEGAPDLGPGLAQEARQTTAHEGRPLDAARACPPLSAAEEAEYNRLVARAKEAKRPEADRIREAWIEGRVAALKAKGMTESAARAALFDAADSCTLPLLFELHFARLGVVTVKGVLDNPEAYIEQRLADPHEGPAYGIGPAILYREPEGLWIRSFAHGGINYYFEREVRADDVLDEVDAETLARIDAQQKAREKAKAERESSDNADSGQAEQPRANPGGGVNFRDTKVKRAPYVWKSWLHRGETVQWFGPPGAGKSASLVSAMLTVAAAAPEGARLAGCRVKPGLVIFAAYERAGETQDRLAAARERLGLPDDLPFVLLTAPPLLRDDKAADAMIEVIRYYEKQYGRPCSTFAIDTLTAARPGMGQSDDGAMSSLMNHLQHIRDVVGCCLVFIHHPTKADANNPRGSGVSTGHVDKEVVVNNGKIKMQKNNAGPNANELALSMEGVNMGEDEDGEPISVAYANIKPGRVAVDNAFPDDMPASSKAKLLRGRLLDVLRARAAEVGRKPYLRSEVVDLVRKEKLASEGDAGRAELSRAIRELKGDGVARDGKGTMEIVFWIDPKGAVQ
jgi:hypothetical protein